MERDDVVCEEAALNPTEILEDDLLEHFGAFGPVEWTSVAHMIPDRVSSGYVSVATILAAITCLQHANHVLKRFKPN